MLTNSDAARYSFPDHHGNLAGGIAVWIFGRIFCSRHYCFDLDNIIFQDGDPRHAKCDT